jgi:hypothetical protein
MLRLAERHTSDWLSSVTVTVAMAFCTSESALPSGCGSRKDGAAQDRQYLRGDERRRRHTSEDGRGQRRRDEHRERKHIDSVVDCNGWTS